MRKLIEFIGGLIVVTKTFNITKRTVSNIKRKYWQLIDSGEVCPDVCSKKKARVGAKFELNSRHQKRQQENTRQIKYSRLYGRAV